MNSTAIASSLSLLCGALLMLIPGYVTDAVGLLCFVPGIREIIGGFLATRLNARTMAGMSSPFAKGFSQQGFSQRGFSKDAPSEDNSFMGFHTSDEANAYQRTSDASDDVIEGEFKEKNSDKALCSLSFHVKTNHYKDVSYLVALKDFNMADTKTNTQDQEAKPQGARQVMIHAQYVKDLSFENPNAVAAHLEASQQPQVEIGVNVNADKINDTQFEVRLNITAKASTEKRALFLVDLTYAAIVSVSEASEEKPLNYDRRPTPDLPFARSIISNMTRDGGFMPLNLQPVDFMAVYRRFTRTTTPCS